MLFAACAQKLPELTQMQVQQDREHLQNELKKYFSPQIKEYSHLIEGTIIGGKKAFLIGAVAANPADRGLEVALMSLEGLVLFSAGHKNGQTIVDRALPPFDNDAFADNMIEDSLLSYFLPKGSPHESGRLSNGDFVLRYRTEDSKVVQYCVRVDKTLEIVLYSEKKLLLKTIIKANTKNRPDEIKITSKTGYSLLLRTLQ